MKWYLYEKLSLQDVAPFLNGGISSPLIDGDPLRGVITMSVGIKEGIISSNLIVEVLGNVVGSSYASLFSKSRTSLEADN